MGTALSLITQSLLPGWVKKKLHESESTLESLKKINRLAEAGRPGAAVKQAALVPPQCNCVTSCNFI